MPRTKTKTNTKLQNLSIDTTMNSRRWRKEFLNLMPWDEYQRNIFEWCLNGTGNLAVEAVAGSGKSTTILGLVACIPPDANAQIMAFNVSIQQRLSNDSRIPTGRVKVNTAHSYGKSMIQTHFAGREPQFNNAKYREIAKKASRDLYNKYSEYEREVSFTKSSLITKEQSEQMLLEINEKWVFPPPKLDELQNQRLIKLIHRLCNLVRLRLVQWREDKILSLARYFDIPINSIQEEGTKEAVEYWIANLVIWALEEGCKQAEEKLTIDYTDMLYLPYYWNLKPRGTKDFLIIDEAQDTSPAMQYLYSTFLEAGSRVIAVGDSAQAIQGFAGAGSDSFENLKQLIKPTELPLSICYRCPKSHLELAQCFVPRIQPKEKAIAGTITVAKASEIFHHIETGTLIICRLTAPLVKLCLKLIVLGHKATIRGKDISVSLLGLVNRSFRKGADFKFFKKIFIDFANEEQKLLEESGEDEVLETFYDKCQAVLYFYNEIGHTYNNINDFKEGIKGLFVDEEEQSKLTINLSTIHRAKGDEAHKVIILGSNILPFTYKCQKGSWQHIQEQNLTYVALTRSKESLVLIPCDRDWRFDGRGDIDAGTWGGLDLPDHTDISTNTKSLPTGNGNLGGKLISPVAEIKALEQKKQKESVLLCHMEALIKNYKLNEYDPANIGDYIIKQLRNFLSMDYEEPISLSYITAFIDDGYSLIFFDEAEITYSGIPFLWKFLVMPATVSMPFGKIELFDKTVLTNLGIEKFQKHECFLAKLEKRTSGVWNIISDTVCKIGATDYYNFLERQHNRLRFSIQAIEFEINKLQPIDVPPTVV